MESQDILHQILMSRENRVKKQKKLIQKYRCSLISFTLNIPGPTKDSLLYREIHGAGMKAILTLLKSQSRRIIFDEVLNNLTGPEGYICVDIEPMELKSNVIKIEENHELGRLFDFDIIDKAHNSISRRDMNIPPRKCLLCSEEALVCKRMKKHTLQELINKVNTIADEYFHKK